MTLTMEALEKHAPKLSAENRKRSAEAFTLTEAASEGSAKAKAKLEESLTTSDFPQLLGVAMNTRLLAEYLSIEPVWPGFCTRDTVPNFKEAKWVDVVGGNGELSLVAEGAPYPRRAFTETNGSWQLAKYGDSLGLTWEMFVNDDLRAFVRLPDKLARSAREQEDRLATMLLTDGSGPNANLFSATAAKGLANADVTTLLTGDLALSETALGVALDQIGARVDYDGRPVVLRGAVLVVPPQLKTTADRIVSTTEYRETIGSNVVVRSNPYAGVVKVVVNPWLNALDAGSKKATNWFVLPDPVSTSKPAAVMAFLAGHEVPDLRVKNDQGTRVGGGSIAPEEGSFDFDTIEYRVRHVIGSGSVDANQVIYSEGDGS